MSKMLLPLVLPVVLGPLVFVVMQGLKAVSATVDRLPAVVKRVAVGVIAALLTVAGGATGVELACDPEAALAAGGTCLEVLDKDAVKAVLTAAIAFGLHWAKAQAKKGNN